MNKIKQGDTVTVLAGKDKGRNGKVLKFLAKNRVLVEGVNMVKKHVRPNPNKQEQGGILEREAGIHVSNVAILNPTSNKADRVGFKSLEDGKKVRCFKSNNEVIDV
ncbi:MAG: 50S ribosomal protein L24 [Gammaproteobacteria bacterium]|nr:50S ribosomal protein L24 [Gammaproteobacteria bacterium]MCH9744865.1 50S ribosomal protein L24 [Gammaproteobacteria bacterium]